MSCAVFSMQIILMARVVENLDVLNLFFRGLLSNMFSQTVGQSAPPTDMRLSAASDMRKNSFFTSFMVCIYSNS